MKGVADGLMIANDGAKVREGDRVGMAVNQKKTRILDKDMTTYAL